MSRPSARAGREPERRTRSPAAEKDRNVKIWRARVWAAFGPGEELYSVQVMQRTGMGYTRVATALRALEASGRLTSRLVGAEVLNADRSVRPHTSGLGRRYYRRTG